MTQRSLPRFLSLVLTGSLIVGCAGEVPSRDPATLDTSTAGAPLAASADTSLLAADTTAGMTSPMPVPVPGGVPARAWSRTELVDGVGRFIRAIDSNDREAFFGSLSDRSLRFIDEVKGVDRDRVWEGAKSSLGDIQDRRITVVGGDADSVTLQVDGIHGADSSGGNEPVRVSLLKENGSWKVMYPGLDYPQAHLRR